MSGPRYLILRGEVYHFQRRVPGDLAGLDPRRFVRKSTKQRDYAKAVVVADQFNRDLEAFWATLCGGSVFENSTAAYDAAVERARSIGLRYKPQAMLEKASLNELVSRMDALDSAGLINSRPAAQAAFGTVEKPQARLSQLVESFMLVAADQLMNKAPDQIRRYEYPRRRAVRNLINVIGDKQLDALTRDDALNFRDWWLDRVRGEGLEIVTANKDIGHIAGMIGDLNDRYRLGLDPVFSGMRIRGGQHKQMPAFSSDWISNRVLQPGALDLLNVEARAVIYIMLNTGMRPSEVVNLTADRIRLDVDVPHVEIAADGRQAKTRQSCREIPLVGISLEAARMVPEGVSRYHGKADNLSATVNKYLREHGLKQTPRHSLYSIRHTFQDRLVAAEAPERVQAELMGHKLHRPRYGKGPSLDQKAAWLGKIAFDASTIAR